MPEELLKKEGEDGSVDGNQVRKGQREERPLCKQPADKRGGKGGRQDDGEKEGVDSACDGDGRQSDKGKGDAKQEHLPSYRLT